MDYETFGEHQWADTGIFDFVRALPREILEHPDNDFVTVSEAVDRYKPKASLDVPHFVSWADTERDLSAWRSNEIQHDALARLYAIREEIGKTKDPLLIRDWQRLSTSDHFYYMCTKWWKDGDVHKYFSPYESPYQAFIIFSNALADLSARLEHSKKIKI
jgi:alpha-amylase